MLINIRAQHEPTVCFNLSCDSNNKTKHTNPVCQLYAFLETSRRVTGERHTFYSMKRERERQLMSEIRSIMGNNPSMVTDNCNLIYNLYCTLTKTRNILGYRFFEAL